MRDTIQRLHAQGGRMTRQRRLILETLSSLRGHPTAEEVHAVARRSAPNLHLSTVYRTLRWLQQAGLVSSRWFADERRQERFDPALPTEHHHFQCTACKHVSEFDDPLLERVKARFARQTGARVASASLVFYGLCDTCQREDVQTFRLDSE